MPQSRHFVVNEYDNFECEYCHRTFKLSSIYNHIRTSCRSNPGLSPEVCNEIQKRNNARSKQYQKQQRASGKNLPYVKVVLKENEVRLKRERFFGRMFFILHNTHPWYLPWKCDIPANQRTTHETADEMVRLMLKKYSK